MHYWIIECLYACMNVYLYDGMVNKGTKRFVILFPFKSKNFNVEKNNCYYSTDL